jgi:hypothetical protein
VGVEGRRGDVSVATDARNVSHNAGVL